ncbi:MAG: hypothetical protein CVT64_00780 [Actinobacteria bacterium HGW-Actinobacteria-4]|nr:MAG: hypothetical protein CVT64_00780 [Actinobacteria bacterium HGW-Actinobacteria-4]
MVVQRFPLGAGDAGSSKSLRPGDHDELARSLYPRNTERYFDALADAREAVAVLVADGIDVARWVDADGFMDRGLSAIRDELARRLVR